jgi:hypothetical protein
MCCTVLCFARTLTHGLRLPRPPRTEQVADPETGDHYFLNHATGEVSWSPPPDWVDENFSDEDGGEGSFDDLELQPGWVQVADPETGEEYFYNVETQQTSWSLDEVTGGHAHGDGGDGSDGQPQEALRGRVGTDAAGLPLLADG